MAIDAGEYYLSTAAGLTATTEAGLAIALTTGTAKQFFFVPCNGYITEYGVSIQTTTSANSLVLNLLVAPTFTGSYVNLTTQNGTVITCTGPSAGLLATSTLRRNCADVAVTRGNIVRFDVTTGVAAGAGILYVKFQPAGDVGKAANDILSTT